MQNTEGYGTVTDPKLGPQSVSALGNLFLLSLVASKPQFLPNKIMACKIMEVRYLASVCT